MSSVVIPRRFRGPPQSANGGYACGVCAAGMGDRAVVTLRKPIPLDVALALEADGDGQVLRAGEDRVAEAAPGGVDAEVPAGVPFAEAEAAMERYAGFAAHPYPECFVCGPARTTGDGVRLFPGAVGDRVAAPFVPHPSICDGGQVRPECVWAVLDCPTYFGALVGQAPKIALLGRLAAEIREMPREGGRYVVLGWPLGADGRKFYGGAAIVDEGGRWLARSRATWIELRSA